MSQLLLVDKRVRQFEAIVGAVAPTVTTVTFDWSSDSLDSILDKIRSLSTKSFDTMGIVQDGNEFMVQYRLVDGCPPADIRDSALTSWEPLLAFFGALKAEFGVATVDFISCSLYSAPHFAETMTALEARLGMDLRASRDRTGNLVAGGNWVQESDGVDIKDLYFTDVIDAYKGVLYKTSWKPSNMMVKADGSNKDWAMVTPAKKVLGMVYAPSSNNAITAWGDNSSGAPTDVGYTAIASTLNAFAALKGDGSIRAWGDSAYGGSGAPTDSGYTAIASTDNAFAALKGDGAITAWGYSTVGAPTDAGYTAIASSYNAFAALKGDGTIRAWGGHGGGYGAPTDSGYIAIASTLDAFAALKGDGTIRAWGEFGASGAPTDSGYITIASTLNAFAALKGDGTITSWSVHGGSGVPTDAGYTAIAAAAYAFAALKADGTIKVWDPATFVASTATINNAPTDAGYIAISSTSNAFAALKQNGSITAWGDYSSGAPTDTGYTAIASTDNAFAALKGDGSITAWGSYGIYSYNITGAPTDAGYISITTNNNAFAALKQNGSITAWGNNYGGPGAPVVAGYTAIASTLNAFAAFKDVSAELSSITVDGYVVTSGSSMPTVYRSNPTIIATPIITTDIVTIIGDSNLSLGSNTVTINVLSGSVTKTYYISVIYENTFPDPTIDEITFDGSRAIVKTIFPPEILSEIETVTLKVYENTNPVGTTPPTYQELYSIYPYSAYNSYLSAWESAVSFMSNSTGFSKLELTIIPKSSSSLTPRTITIKENVYLGTPTFTVDISGNFTAVVQPNIPAALSAYDTKLRVFNPSFVSNLTSSASSFTYVPPYPGFYSIAAAEASLPYSIYGIPFISTQFGTVFFFEIYDTTLNIMYTGNGVPLSNVPDISAYTNAEMAALTAEEIVMLMGMRQCIQVLSISQLAAMTAANVTAAAALMTTDQLDYYKYTTSRDIEDIIRTALTATNSTYTSTEIETVLRYHAIINGTSHFAFKIENANLSRLQAGLSTSENIYMCVAQPSDNGTPSICYLTEISLNEMNNGTKLYIIGGPNTQIKLMKYGLYHTIENIAVITYDASENITINNVSKAVGDTTDTVIGWLLFSNKNVFYILDIPDTPEPPGVSATSTGPNINITVTPHSNAVNAAVQGYNVFVNPINSDVTDYSTAIQYTSSSSDFTYDTLKGCGNFAYSGTNPFTHMLNMPISGGVYRVSVEAYSSTTSTSKYDAFTDIALPSITDIADLSSVISSFTPAQLNTLDTSTLRNLALNQSSAFYAMNVAQIAALPLAAIMEAIAAEASGTEYVRMAIENGVNSSVNAAVTGSSGNIKADVDGALMLLTKVALTNGIYIPALTVTGANMGLINTGAPASVDTVFLSAGQANADGDGYICYLSTTQLATLAAGGHIYIGGGSSDRVRLVSGDDYSKIVSIEFGSAGAIIVDGVSHAVGDSVVTALGTLNLLFGGSLQGSFDASNGSGSGGSGGEQVQALATPMFNTPAIENGYIYMTWSAVTNAASYGLQLSDNNGTTWTTEITTTNTHKMFDTLTVGTLYKFRIRAIPDNGSTLYSASDYAAPFERMCYGTPGAPSVSASVSGGLINIAFGAPSSNGGSPINEYTVYVLDTNFQQIAYSSTSANYSPNQTVGGTFTTAGAYTLLNVPVDGRTYTIQVMANNEIGFGSDPVGEAIVQMPSVASLVLGTSDNSGEPGEIGSVSAPSAPLPLAAIGALKKEDVKNAASDPVNGAGFVSKIKQSVQAGLSTKLAASSTAAPGSAKADVDKSTKTLAAAEFERALKQQQQQGQLSMALQAQPVSSGSLNLLDPSMPAEPVSITLAPALPPDVTTGEIVTYTLTTQQEADIAAGGVFYIPGSNGEAMKFKSQDGLRSVLFEFPATNVVMVDGVARNVGDIVSTQFGNITLLFKGSVGGRGVPAIVNPGPVCFLADAPVLTPSGYKRISEIKEGDMVHTAAGRTVTVKRVFAKEYTAGPSVNPFVIPKGSFGALRALPISPNHEVMVPGRGMLKAKELGLRRMKMTGPFTYYNIELEDWVRDNLVVAGVECESLAPAERITMTKAEFSRFVKARYGPAAAARLRLQSVCFEEEGGRVSMPKL